MVCITTRSAPENASVGLARNARRKMCAAKYSRSPHFTKPIRYLTQNVTKPTGEVSAHHSARHALAMKPFSFAWASFFARASSAARAARSAVAAATKPSRHSVMHVLAARSASSTAAATCGSPLTRSST